MSTIDLAQELSRRAPHGDGELVLRHRTTWALYVLKGQPFYVTDRLHPVRRWDRALRQQGSTWNWELESPSLLSSSSWQCQLLEYGVNHGRLSLLRAKLMIRSLVQECLFELGSSIDLESDWYPGLNIDLSSCKPLALSVWEIQTVSNKVTKLLQQWHDHGLTYLNPNAAPVLAEPVPPETLSIPVSYLDGSYTLWDIAWRIDKTIVEVASALVPWAEESVLHFQAIPDLPLALSAQMTERANSLPKFELPRSTTNGQFTASPSKSALIACIDDSPVLAHTLNRILTSGGYKTLNIQEPMRGFTQLIEHKPDLILLDLQLPNADGYSVCKFLRDTPVFAKTPIIILTGQNTVVDRIRAKQAGATEFLGKPPRPEDLLKTVQRYLDR